MPTLFVVMREWGTSSAAVMKKAAEEISPGYEYPPLEFLCRVSGWGVVRVSNRPPKCLRDFSMILWMGQADE